MPPPPRRPPSLADELVEEILLRLPPDSPASLVRAGLVCKRWGHIVADPTFRRQFIDFHGRSPPPMLGFLVFSDELVYRDVGARFVPISAAAAGGRLPHAYFGLWPCDSRHGRVLLRTTSYNSFGNIIVWNPITGEQLTLPNPPPTATGSELHPYNWGAAVLCIATATTTATGDACDHLDCHRRGPFIVVLVGKTTFSETFTCIYSSETGVWSQPTVAPERAESIASWTRSTLVGNELYFVLDSHKSILEYNLCTRRTSTIRLPFRVFKNNCSGPIQLTTMEDSRLGFVTLDDYSRLCLWSKEDEQPSGWVLSKFIELDKLIPLDLDDRRVWWLRLVGSAEGVGTIFLNFKDELFTVDLRSGQMNNVYTHQGLRFGNIVVPYMNFCTPVMYKAPMP